MCRSSGTTEHRGDQMGAGPLQAVEVQAGKHPICASGSSWVLVEAPGYRYRESLKADNQACGCRVVSTRDPAALWLGIGHLLPVVYENSHVETDDVCTVTLPTSRNPSSALESTCFFPHSHPSLGTSQLPHRFSPLHGQLLSAQTPHPTPPQILLLL